MKNHTKKDRENTTPTTMNIHDPDGSFSPWRKTSTESVVLIDMTAPLYFPLRISLPTDIQP